MSALDPAVANLVDHTTNNGASDPDTDALFAELEADDSFPALRERRMQQLHEELNRVQKSRSSHETYETITSEKELLNITTTTPRCLVHFFHTDFHRCSVMDRHLEALAQRHYETRFLRVDVKNVEWLCEKLGVKVLPCVIGFVEGQGKCRVVGFEGLGGDNFGTAALERKLVDGEVLVREKMGGEGETGGLRRGNAKKEDSDDDDDWD